MKKADIFEFYRRLAESNPDPETELAYGNAYQLLVAVTCSAQSTDVGVNKATKALFEEVKTPAQMVALGLEGLKDHIKTIGLYNNKAKNVIALSEILVRDHAGEVPADRDALEALPGVGRKTANVVMNTAFGAETFAVDTHIFRLGNRTGIAPGKTVVAVEKALEKSTPKPFRVGAIAGAAPSPTCAASNPKRPRPKSSQLKLRQKGLRASRHNGEGRCINCCSSSPRLPCCLVAERSHLRARK